MNRELQASRPAAPSPIQNTTAASTPDGMSYRMGGDGIGAMEYNPRNNTSLQRTSTLNPDGTATVSMQIDPKYGGGVASATNVPTGTVTPRPDGGTTTAVHDPYLRYTTPAMQPREVEQLRSDVAAPNDPYAVDRMKRREFLTQRQTPKPMAPATVAPATPIPMVKPIFQAKDEAEQMAQQLAGGGRIPTEPAATPVSDISEFRINNDPFKRKTAAR